MREMIEKAILWSLELTGRCLFWLLQLLSIAFIWGTPILMLYLDGNEASDVFWWIWIILLYPGTIGALLFALYEYLIIKHRGGKMPNNAFTRHMTSENTNGYFE